MGMNIDYLNEKKITTKTRRTLRNTKKMVLQKHINKQFELYRTKNS